MRRLAIAIGFAALANSALATTWVIGDNDGYGIGIPDNGTHPFNGTTANFDGRSAAEKVATNGAQFTDTYSTTHAGFGPQAGTAATFTFSALGTGWAAGTMIFDMADFQATSFGAVATTFNGIAQNWAFNDGFPNTVLRVFSLSQAVLNSINSTGTLTVIINRNASVDFYGFDYAALTNTVVTAAEVPGLIPAVPEPSTVVLFLLGAGIIARTTKRGRCKR